MASTSQLKPRHDGSLLSKEDIDDLKATVKGSVIVKGEASEDQYRQAIDRWAETGIKEAHIVVYVEDEEDISHTIRFITKHNLDAAVAGGRHSYHGASSASGLVLDLRKMKSVKIDREAKTITAQGGCLAVDLEVPLQEYGLAIVMGHVNDTGIGGISTGGGAGWLTGQHGNIVDNILSVRVALADGRIVVASEQQTPDLFWGIRGGGCNFGICTEFTYQAHDQGDVFLYFGSGITLFPPEKTNEIVSLVPRMYELIGKSRGKLQAFMIMLAPPGSTAQVPGWTIFYDGHESHARELLHFLFELEPIVDTTHVVEYASINGLHKGYQVEGHRRNASSVAHLSVPLEKDILMEGARLYTSFLAKYGDLVPQSMMIVEVQSPHVSKSVPVDAMAYANRHETVPFIVELKWDDPSLDQTMRQEVIDIVGQVRKLARDKQGGLVSVKQNVPPGDNDEAKTNKNDETNVISVYANYSGGAEKLASIFGPNLPQLRQLKKKYDPDCVFDKWYCIPPAE